ncbi:hydrogen gas-evolving membrane-bound hydrogenase subunit E [Clostridium rectalis]|uniref:hydrogen gas-evolving membrane-bound hydrogenase subunit E n=1 Tax=Clostridium rectalis TaxID=2040295 RepID=UPI000F62C5B0|nr:hydrogen gas-evolving membrane-bound hydrogenase subunit E [Clostridium rectalis]
MNKVIGVLITVLITITLLLGVMDLPQFGNDNNPTHNEVSKYYIDNSIKDTGATNIVTGVILDYRAFDTFVEASVLFTSTITVMILLKKGIKG